MFESAWISLMKFHRNLPQKRAFLKVSLALPAWRLIVGGVRLWEKVYTKLHPSLEAITEAETGDIFTATLKGSSLRSSGKNALRLRWILRESPRATCPLLI